MSAPERIWVWCLNGVRHGGWRDWGGYARADRRYPLDGVEEETGAEYIRADLAPAAPKVKALVWKWHRDPRDTAEARTTIGTWTIWEIDGSAYCHGPNDTCGKPCKGGLDGAKATAQADYEARILAALEGGDG